MLQKTLLNSEIISKSTEISSKYHLCEHCLGRLFLNLYGGTSSKLLGKKIQKLLNLNSSQKCYICKNTLENISFNVEKIYDILKNYDYKTFEIGSILKPSMIDRDDQIRSNFDLHADSLKHTITTELSANLIRKTKKSLIHKNPDVVATMNFKTNQCDVKSRSIVLFGKYIKKSRGFPQKQTPCSDCKGKGCIFCNNHGITSFESIEGQIANFLYHKFQTQMTKFTWIGGEDKNSLVLGSGRPFFVKIHSPKKRSIQFRKNITVNDLMLADLHEIPQLPRGNIAFRSTVKLFITTSSIIENSVLKLLKNLINYSIIIEESKKQQKRTLYDLKYKKTSANSFTLWITVDGGLPIKRFVTGDDVFPNISESIQTNCSCVKYDFLDIVVQI